MRKALLLLALAWGALVVVIATGWVVADDDPGTAALVFAAGTVLLLPVALPLLVLRSRWYRLTAFTCGLLALTIYTALALVYAYLLWPSALLVLLSVLPPQRP
jgi:hypothetical protein